MALAQLSHTLRLPMAHNGHRLQGFCRRGESLRGFRRLTGAHPRAHLPLCTQCTGWKISQSLLKLGGLNVACVQKQAAPSPHQFKAVPDRPAVAGVAGPGLSPKRGDRVMRDQAQRSRSLRIRDSGDSRHCSAGRCCQRWAIRSSTSWWRCCGSDRLRIGREAKTVRGPYLYNDGSG